MPVSRWLPKAERGLMIIPMVFGIVFVIWVGEVWRRRVTRDRRETPGEKNNVGRKSKEEAREEKRKKRKRENRKKTKEEKVKEREGNGEG